MNQLAFKNSSLKITYYSRNCEESPTHENTLCHHSTGLTIEYRKNGRGNCIS